MRDTNNLQDVESILEFGGTSALKTFVKTSIVRLHDLMAHGSLEDIKADLLYRQRTVDWLKAKASTEQEEAFLIGYYCGILSECEETLKKRFQGETDRKICSVLNSLNIPDLKNIIQVINEHPGIGHHRVAEMTQINENELSRHMNILTKCHAIILSKPFKQCYYQVTSAGLKYAGIKEGGDSL